MQDRPQLEKRLDALTLSVDTLRRFTVLLTHIREDRHGRAWILLDAPLIGMPPIVIGGAP